MVLHMSEWERLSTHGFSPNELWVVLYWNQSRYLYGSHNTSLASHFKPSEKCIDTMRLNLTQADLVGEN